MDGAVTIDAARLGEFNRVVRERPGGAEINIGHYRHHPVGIQGYGPPGPDHVQPLVEDLCRW